MNPDLHALVKRLKRANASYAKLEKKRQIIWNTKGPFNSAFNALQDDANTINGNIMRTERAIINLLLK